jgi:hypothetical protein
MISHYKSPLIHSCNQENGGRSRRSAASLACTRIAFAALLIGAPAHADPRPSARGQKGLAPAAKETVLPRRANEEQSLPRPKVERLPTPPSALGLWLSAIVNRGASKQAFIFQGNSHEGLWVREGASVGKLTVSSIEPQSIVLKGDGASYRLILNYSDRGAGTVETSPPIARQRPVPAPPPPPPPGNFPRGVKDSRG